MNDVCLTARAMVQIQRRIGAVVHDQQISQQGHVGFTRHRSARDIELFSLIRHLHS